MKKVLLIGFLMGWSTLGIAQDKDTDTGNVTEPETFEMKEGDTTYVMQKYFVVFLKSGPNRSQDQKEAEEIQKAHMTHLQEMAEMGKTSITGPMAGEGDIRGIVIFNTATEEEARQLAEKDPAVKAGRLVVEVHPWWAAKGSTLK